MPPASLRHYGCRIQDDVIYKGLRTLYLENDHVRVGVLLDKGADIYQFLHKPSDTDFLWRSPTGIQNPQRFTATRAADEGAFLDRYHGGWQEILPGGGPTVYKGAALGLHGEATLLGWNMDIVEDDADEIAVRLSVQLVRMPFNLERTMRLRRGEPTLFIEERLTNRSPEDLDFMWGHHPTFGAPFLREGVRLIVPAQTAVIQTPRFMPCSIFQPGAEFAWPTAITPDGRAVDLSHVPGPQAGFADLMYLKELSAGWYALLDPARQVGVGLAWPKEVFPYLWFWMVYGLAPGYPWWNQVYCLALEPWTSIPDKLQLAQAAGTQAHLKGGATLEVAFCATAISGRRHVEMIHPDGRVE